VLALVLSAAGADARRIELEVSAPQTHTAAPSAMAPASDAAPGRAVTVVLPDGEIAVGASAVTPGCEAALVGSGRLRGASLAVVRVIAPARGTVRIHVDTAPEPQGDEAGVRRLRPDAVQDAEDAAALRALVANPSDVAFYHPAHPVVQKPAPQRFRPTSYPD